MNIFSLIFAGLIGMTWGDFIAKCLYGYWTSHAETARASAIYVGITVVLIFLIVHVKGL